VNRAEEAATTGLQRSLPRPEITRALEKGPGDRRLQLFTRSRSSTGTRLSSSAGFVSTDLLA
jgi:hypothetical protein